MTKISRSSRSTVPTGRPTWRTAIRTVADGGESRRATLRWLVVLALALSASCREDNPAEALIRRARTAEQTHAYRGTKSMLTVSRERKRIDLIVTHFADMDGTGAPTITEWSEPSRSRRRVDWRSRHDFWLSETELLFRNYRARIAEATRVADRTGTRVALEARDPSIRRPSVSLVVDDETGLMLSYRLLDWQGNLAFEVAFTSLVVDPPEMPERPVREEKDGAADPKREDPAEPGFTLLAPRHLPKGFRAKGPPERSGRRGDGWKTVYFDGLTWFVLSQRKAREGAEEGVVERRRRGTYVWLSMTHEGVFVSLYGQLDPAEFEEVLRSLGPVQ